MPKVPMVSGGVGHVPAGGPLGMALGAGIQALASGSAASAPTDAATDAAMARALRLPGAPAEESPRTQAHRDLVTATQGLPAAQRAALQMQLLSDPAAWGAE